MKWNYGSIFLTLDHFSRKLNQVTILKYIMIMVSATTEETSFMYLEEWIQTNSWIMSTLE